MSSIDGNTSSSRIEIPDKTFFKIGEVAKLLGVEPYVLRYWESEFDLLEPEKTKSGQRVYQREDIELLSTIRDLLYQEMFTIAGARRQLERMREGKATYVTAHAAEADSHSEVQAEGVNTASAEAEQANEQTLLMMEEAARLESYADELEQARAELQTHCARLEAEVAELRRPRPEAMEKEKLIAQLQREIAEMRNELEAMQARASQGIDESNELRKQHDERRRGLMQALRQEVEVLANLAYVTV